MGRSVEILQGHQYVIRRHPSSTIDPEKQSIPELSHGTSTRTDPTGTAVKYCASSQRDDKHVIIITPCHRMLNPDFLPSRPHCRYCRRNCAGTAPSSPSGEDAAGDGGGSGASTAAQATKATPRRIKRFLTSSSRSRGSKSK